LTAGEIEDPSEADTLDDYNGNDGTTIQQSAATNQEIVCSSDLTDSEFKPFKLPKRRSRVIERVAKRLSGYENAAQFHLSSKMPKRRSSATNVLRSTFRRASRGVSRKEPLHADINDDSYTPPRLQRRRSSLVRMIAEKFGVGSSDSESNDHIITRENGSPQMPRRRSSVADSEASFISQRKTCESPDSKGQAETKKAVDLEPKLPRRRSTIKDSIHTSTAAVEDLSSDSPASETSFCIPDGLIPDLLMLSNQTLIEGGSTLDTVIEGEIENSRFFDYASTSRTLEDASQSSNSKCTHRTARIDMKTTTSSTHKDKRKWHFLAFRGLLKQRQRLKSQRMRPGG
jgi:hypothetical protein